MVTRTFLKLARGNPFTIMNKVKIKKNRSNDNQQGKYEVEV
jgi:hypothetical protein